MFSDLVSVVVAPLLLSLVTAAPLAPVVLPQDSSYVLNVSSQVANGNFVSDPTVAGSVLAETDEDNEVPASTGGVPLLLQVSRPFCVGVGGLLSYRIVITNTGEDPLYDLLTVDTHPNMPVRNMKRAPDDYSEEARRIVWQEAELLPDQSITYSFEVPRLKDHVENRVEVTYGIDEDNDEEDEDRGQVLTHYELISDNCSPPVEGEIPPTFSYTPLPSKRPAIFCAPQEEDCIEATPILGVRFGVAEHYEYNPTFKRNGGLPLGIEIDYEEKKPELGVNFEHATPSPHPGECRVIGEDDIPGYQGLPAVQVTWCESGSYPERLLRGAPEPVKAKFGSIRLPDTAVLPSPEPDSIDIGIGEACTGLPGDPWWATDCSCECGDFVLLPTAQEFGAIVPCGQDPLPPITRHDIFVSSQAECKNDPGHEDSVF